MPFIWTGIVFCYSFREQPFSWAVEVSSGQGSKEVKTSLYLSDKPLVDHIHLDLGKACSCFCCCCFCHVLYWVGWSLKEIWHFNFHFLVMHTQMCPWMSLWMEKARRCFTTGLWRAVVSSTSFNKGKTPYCKKNQSTKVSL